MSIKDLTGNVESESERQFLDIAREIFMESDAETKSKLNRNEIVTFSRALWYGNQYDIPEIESLVGHLLLMKRSEGALGLKSFKEVLKGMKPELTQNQGGKLEV